MKIGFVVGKISFGGGERILETLINEMHGLGHTIYVYSWDNEWNDHGETLPYRITVLDHPPVRLLGKYKAFRALRRSLLIDKPGCLIVFSLALAEVAVFSAISSGIPIFLSERVDPVFLPKEKIHRFLKKIIFLLADGVVFQTEQVKKYFSSGIQKKSIVIPNPIMDPIPLSKNVLLFKREIVAAGRLSEEKNFQMLIKAFADVNASGYTLRIFGEGLCHVELRDLIVSLNMENKIFLEGKVNGMIGHIINADIFVLSSNHEGMPNVLLEAMACGLACISTDFRSGGARSIITHGVNGILIPVNDVVALKNSIQYLINNPAYKEILKKNATKIRDRNDTAKIIPMWINFIKAKIVTR